MVVYPTGAPWHHGGGGADTRTHAGPGQGKTPGTHRYPQHTLSVSHLCCYASTYSVYYSSSYLLSLKSSVPSPHGHTYSVMLSRIVMILVCWYTVIIFRFKTMG